MASKYWLKLYHEILDDGKVMMLGPALRWRFVECLLVAGELDDGGYLLDSQKYAWRVRADLKTVESELNDLAAAGLLSNEDGRWFVCKFEERQAAMPKAEYMKRLRKDRQGKRYPTVTKPVTKSVTISNTDIDKDIDKEEKREDEIGGDFQELETMAKLILSVIRPIYTEQEQADLKIIASSFCESGVTEAHVKGFPHWFEANGFYSAGTNPNKKKPSLINLTNDFLTYLGEVEDGVYAELEA